MEGAHYGKPLSSFYFLYITHLSSPLNNGSSSNSFPVLKIVLSYGQ